MRIATVTLALPLDTPLPVIAGKWRIMLDGILAEYTRDELELCLLLADIWTKEAEDDTVTIDNCGIGAVAGGAAHLRGVFPERGHLGDGAPAKRESAGGLSLDAETD